MGKKPIHFGDRKGLSRRELFRLAGATGASLAIGGGVGVGAALAAKDIADAEGSPVNASVPFFGRNQAGIATPQQDRLVFAAFDLTTEDVSEVRDLLREWSTAAALMSEGRPVGDESENGYLPPDDTGEALGLSPARLTLTFGLGTTLFEHDGEDRFGLAALRPAVLEDIPWMPGDSLEPERSGGDLCVQACADDPQVAFHAIRNLTRIARGIGTMRWSQIGFGRTSSTSNAQDTPRNLFGFKDGTNNVKAEDGELMDGYVWVRQGDEPAWMQDGTYLVARRIRMLIEVWDRSSLNDQEQTIGRHRLNGAPIGSEDEFDAVDLEATGPNGKPLIPTDSHVRLSRENPDEQILRRGYSFTDGMDPKRGQLDAGLFFISFQRDPQRQFVPLQRRLAENDALNEYISHTGSALFACPPGARDGGYVGETLFERA
jgi:deferrochelatase/peroxidase EfeB